MLSRRIFCGIAGAAALPVLRRRMAAKDRPPNVVFILADDLGLRDTSLYGSSFYQTPNIEALARRGMMFTQAYAAAPICSPTRASIQTGLYPARLGIIRPSCHEEKVVLQQTVQTNAPPAQKALDCSSITRLKLEYFTLAEALKGAGYATAHFGKWHLGREPYDALHQGFDVDIPHWYGGGPAGSYIAPWKFPEFKGQPGEHIEDRMSQEATRFIRENKDRPFYVNYWCFSVHEPWNAKQTLIDKYKAKADPKNPQHNAVYAAMVESMDDAVGALMRTLDETGVADNTIVIFFSDNGGVIREPGDHMQHEGYRDIPITSNAPLRGGKGTVYEGGTREPCVVVWPGKVKSGSKSDQVICSVDFYPTLLKMTGVTMEKTPAFDGQDFSPALGGKRFDRKPVFCHYPVYNTADNKPGTWVRKDDWKLIRFWFDNDDQSHRFELYNLKKDVGETNNLAGATPQKVRELDALLDEFLRDTNAVVPKPNPAYLRDRPAARRGKVDTILRSDDSA